MKAIKLLFMLLLCVAMSAFSQDLPRRKDDKRFVVRSVDGNILKVNFLEDNKISDDIVVEINEKSVVTGPDKKQSFDLKSIRSAMIFKGDFDFIPNENYYKAVTIKLEKTLTDGSFNGRIDLTKQDYSLITGHKVALANAGKIKGTGVYIAVSATTLNAEMQGIAIAVSGTYTDGKVLAKTVTLKQDPDDDNVIKSDIPPSEKDVKAYEQFKPFWNSHDHNKRKKLMTADVEGFGKVYNDDDIQDYASEVGMKLVPEWIKKKISFMFVVVDNDDVNAYAKPNGFVYITKGLIMSCSNEAQLAAVLGHEIAHTMEKHVRKQSDAKRAVEIFNKVKSIFLKKKDLTEEEKNINSLSNNLVSIWGNKYTKSQELEADRIGLSLMAEAGYNVLEAATCWKNLYDVYSVYTDKTMASLKKLDELSDELNFTADTATALNSVIASVNKDMESDTETHPEPRKRFEQINNFISLYWYNQDKSMTEGNHKKITERIKNPKKATVTAPAPTTLIKKNNGSKKKPH